jgi:hypothetical protein
MSTKSKLFEQRRGYLGTQNFERQREEAFEKETCKTHIITREEVKETMQLSG